MKRRQNTERRTNNEQKLPLSAWLSQSQCWLHLHKQEGPEQQTRGTEGYIATLKFTAIETVSDPGHLKRSKLIHSKEHTTMLKDFKNLAHKTLNFCH